MMSAGPGFSIEVKKNGKDLKTIRHGRTAR